MSFQDLEAGGRRSPASSRRDLITTKQDSTQAVASGIFQINTAVSTFQRLVNTLGTPKDTPELREKLHKTRLYIGQLVKDTSAKLKQASETDHDTNVSASKKIADAKLAKDFQAVLKEFQKAQRLAAERETAYTPFVPQAALPSSYTDGEVDANSEKASEQRLLLVQARREEVLLLDNEISFNEAIIEERDQGIQEIQQQIGEVNEIFKDLAVLVHDQGTMIDDIGSNVENAHVATAQGRSQLGKAAKSQKSNSSLALQISAGLGFRHRGIEWNLASREKECTELKGKIALLQSQMDSNDSDLRVVSRQVDALVKENTGFRKGLEEVRARAEHSVITAILKTRVGMMRTSAEERSSWDADEEEQNWRELYPDVDFDEEDAKETSSVVPEAGGQHEGAGLENRADRDADEAVVGEFLSSCEAGNI